MVVGNDAGAQHGEPGALDQLQIDVDAGPCPAGGAHADCVATPDFLPRYDQLETMYLDPGSVCGEESGNHVGQDSEDDGRPEGRGRGSPLSVVYCGDDAKAKDVGVRLIRDVGCEPIDAGPLRIARYTEPFALLVAQLAYEGDRGPALPYRFEWFEERKV